MTASESLPVRIVYAVSGALKPVMGEDSFEIVPDGQSRALYVSADDWTVNIEWERGIAWLAVDDEPDDAAGYERARRALMSEAVEDAWRAIDNELAGFLVDALQRSGDAFSIAFANAIAASSLDE
ncbi:hypothetical protein BH23CHL4_BH23CHL4_19250 [soil metagenome]